MEMEMLSFPCKRGYWRTKSSITFPWFPKLCMALVTREKFHLAWPFPSLGGQRRCFAVADECCSGHSWIEHDTIHLSSEANPVIQDKGPSSLGLEEDSPDLGSSPTHTHRAGAAALAPDLDQVLLPLPISDSVRSSGHETTFPSAGLISYFPFRH